MCHVLHRPAFVIQWALLDCRLKGSGFCCPMRHAPPTARSFHKDKGCYRPAATRVTSRCPKSSVGGHCGHSGETRHTSKSYASLLHLPDSSRNAKVYSWTSGARSPTRLQNKSHLAFRHIQPDAKTFPCFFA